MHNYFTLLFVYKKIWNLISSTKKKLFSLYIFFSIFSLIVDIISILLLTSIINYALLGKIKILEYLNEYINITGYSYKNIFLVLSFLFLFLIVISSILKFLLVLINSKISYGIIHEFNTLIFNKLAYLNLLGNSKININSSISNLSKVEEITNMIIANLYGVSSLIIASGILITLFLVDFKVLLLSSVFFFTVYFILSKISERVLLFNSKSISQNINFRTEVLSTLLNSIRNVILDRIQIFFIKNYKNYDLSISRSRISNALIASVPSLVFINIIFAIFVVFIVNSVIFEKNLLEDIAKLSGIAFGAQKLIPLLNNIYGAISKNRSSYYSVTSVLRFIYIIRTKKPNYFPSKTINKKKTKELKFNENFLLRKITFGYSNDNIILNNLNFFIKKNERILILGQSGSGKSTLIDIITGLIKVKSGYLKVDNFTIDERNLHIFQNYISLVPQEVFLAETSFLKNISLGNSLKDIDIKKAKFCAKIAEIDRFISKTKHGYNTIVSYNGSNLSGGQKQRIGIARALYKGAEILIFDESTSAIDDKTEKKIFNNFKRILKNKTIIFVSHKKKNIKYFNKVYNLSNGKLKKKIF